MTSIDDLFRKPNAPTKRKLEDPTSSFLQHHKQQQPSSNKAVKLSNGDSPHSQSTNRNGTAGQSKSKSRLASVQDEAEDEQMNDEEDDAEAGSSLPPPEDEDPDEDDEGRFFGSGVSKQEREVLDYIDRNDGADGSTAEPEEKIDSPWLRKTAINFERIINKNAELRAKYEDDPIKFVGSEADLDSEIKGLSVLSEHAELYAEFVKLGCMGSLVGLLAHENTDIVISVCEVLEELTDEDLGIEEEQWKVLVNDMVKNDVVDLLVSNLRRLDESNDNDRAGVYHVLNVIENLSSDTANLDKVGKNTQLYEWLKMRIQLPDSEARGKVGQNRQYAAEVLAILLQGNEKNRQRFVKVGGVDLLLQLLSIYRKKDPEKDSDEEEFMENLFDCLVALVKDKNGADDFLQNEGIELCLIMVREGKVSKSRALRVLDHAAGGSQGGTVGERIVEAAGLKTIFSNFMKSKKQEREMTEHLIGIFASLLRYLPVQSAARIRTLAKFVEKEYEKIIRLTELRKEYAARLNGVNAEIEQERRRSSKEEIEELEPEWLSRRFDAGLFSLQTLDVVLAWLIAEDDGVNKKTRELLDIKILRRSLQEQLDGIDTDAKDTRDMLEALIRCLV